MFSLSLLITTARRRAAVIATASRPAKAETNACAAECLEGRMLLSFASSMSGPFQAVWGQPYTAYVHATGSQAPTSETFKFSGGSPGTITVTPPTQNPQPASNTYSQQEVNVEFAVKADVTPSGGSMSTIPISLNSQFGGIGTAPNTGKIVEPPANASSGQGYAVDTDGNGNTFIGGPFTGATDGRQTFAVSKFTANGTLDIGFGNNGTKEIDIPVTGPDIVNDIELVGDSDLYLAGTSVSMSGTQWVVAKLSTSTGALDTAFDGDGIRTGFQTGGLNAAHVNHSSLFANDLLLGGGDTSGQMIVYSLDRGTGVTNWVRATTFDAAVYDSQAAYDLVGQTDGKVVAAGWACRPGVPGGSDFALVRFNADGSPDDGSPSDSDPTDRFGTNGKVTTNFGCLITGACHAPSYDTAYAVMQSTDGNSLYAVGKTNYSGPDQFAAVSYLTSNGNRDPSFHTSGLPIGLATGPDGIGYAAQVQDDTNDTAGFGKIIVGGAGTPGSTSSDFVLARFNTVQSGATTGGALDTTFGLVGWTKTDFDKSNTYTSGYDECRGLDIVRSGTAHRFNIVAAGFTAATSTSTRFLAIAEYFQKNTILVVSPRGSGPLGLSPAGPGDAPATFALDAASPSALLLGPSDDDLLSSA